MNKYLIATGTIAALLTATPAFADSHGLKNTDGLLSNLNPIVHVDNDNEQDTNVRATTTVKTGDNGLGAQVRIFAHEDGHGGLGKIVSELAHRLHRDLDRGHKGDHATTTATTTVHIAGTVSAINGTTLTISGKNGATYTVNAANVVVNNVKVGDTVEVTGTLTGSTIVATKIEEKPTPLKDVISSINALRGGLVTALTGTGFTLNGATTVNTNASTTYLMGGHATTSGAVATGTNVLAFGTSSTSTPDTITAQIVVILGQGLEFLRNLFLAR